MKNIPPNRSALVAIVFVTYAMIIVDNSIVITGLPAIKTGLGFSVTQLTWIQNAYALTFGGLMLLGARASDLLGRRITFQVGLAIFSLSSLSISLASTPAWLIGARAAQGIGSAILAPSTLTLLSTSFAEGPERNRVLGWYGAIGGVTASIGLVLGGVLAQLVSWRAGFFINVPIGILLVCAAQRYISETPPGSGHIDLAGAFFSTIGVAALVYGLVHAAEESWMHWQTAVPLLMGAVCLAAFIAVESRSVRPILPLRLFLHRERSGANVARIFFIGASTGFFFYTTQYFQGVLGMGPMMAGLAFFPSMLVNFVVAMNINKLSQHWGVKPVLLGTIFISFVGMILLGRAGAGTSYIFGVQLPMVLIGAGMGSSLALLTVSGVAQVDPRDAGSASGLVGVSHQLGGALGLAILVVAFACARVPAGSTATVELGHRVGVAITTGAALLALAFLMVLLFVGTPSRPQPAVAGES